MTGEEHREMDRFIDRHHLRKSVIGTDGRPTCRWCGGSVPKGRLTWCSQRCVDEYMVRSSPSDARRLVFARDKGVCALCGINTEKAKQDLQRAHRAYFKELAFVPRWLVSPAAAMARVAGWPSLRMGWWEADHIIPVCRGGGACGLDNYRTLCVRCHRAETKRLAAERAEERRQKA